MESLLHGLHLCCIALLGVGGCLLVLMTGLVSLCMIHQPRRSSSSSGRGFRRRRRDDPIQSTSGQSEGKQQPKLLSQEKIDWVTKRQWKEVLAWIVFHPDELQHLDKTGQSILHHVCLFRAPAEVVGMILWQAPELARLPNPDGEVPLHWAIRLSAPLEQIESLLQAAPTVGTRGKDKDGNSPLSLLWDRHREAILETWWLHGCEKVKTLHSWKRIMLFFPYQTNENDIDNNNEDTTDNNKNSTTHLHVACRCPTPPGFFLLMVQVFMNDVLTRDENGQTPLHIACSDAVANRSSDAKSKVQTLLSVRTVSTAPCCTWRDDWGRLPLHYALQAGFTWEEGLRELLECHPQSLNERDPLTRLDPYLLAASAELDTTGSGEKDGLFAAAAAATTTTTKIQASTRNLNTIYALLRMNPSQLVTAGKKNIVT